MFGNAVRVCIYIDIYTHMCVQAVQSYRASDCLVPQIYRPSVKLLWHYIGRLIDVYTIYVVLSLCRINLPVSARLGNLKSACKGCRLHVRIALNCLVLSYIVC